MLPKCFYIVLLMVFIHDTAMDSVEPENYKAVNEHETAVIKCGNKDEPGVTVEWRKEGLDIVSVNPRFSEVNGSLVINNTLQRDGGLYECRNIVKKKGGVFSQSVNMFLNVRYAPNINNILPSVEVYEGKSVVLPCSASGNPGVIFRWKLPSGADLKGSKRFVVATNGSLVIHDVELGDARNYTCAPYNEIGSAKFGYTVLKVYIRPSFLKETVETVIKTRAGEEVTLDCSCSGIPTPNVTWVRDTTGVLDKNRWFSNSIGLLTITDIQDGDHGRYNCSVSSIAGKLSRSFVVIVQGKPSTPLVTNIHTRDNIVYINWKPAYNGGSKQSFQFWYRPDTQSEYKWDTVTPSLDVSKFIDDQYKFEFHLNKPTKVSFMLAVRAQNSEGYSGFSDVFKVRRSSRVGVTLKASRLEQKQQPLPPYKFLVNITRVGYSLSWKYMLTPGRPDIVGFVISYRSKNSSSGWTKYEPGLRRRRSSASTSSKIKQEMIYAKDLPGVKHPLEFKIASLGKGGVKSDTVQPKVRVITGMKAVESKDNNIAAIVLGCIFGGFVIVLLISLYCFCRRRKKRYHASRNEKKIVEYNKQNGYDRDNVSLEATDGTKLLSPKFDGNDSPRRFHLRHCPALSLGKYDNQNSNGTKKDDVYVLLEPNDAEKHVCTCNKKYLTLNSRDQKSKREKKKGLYKSSSSPSVLLTSDADVSSIDPSELLDEEDYDISDIEKDDVGELSQVNEKFGTLNRKNFKDSYDQFCRPDTAEGSRHRLSSSDKTEVDKNIELSRKLKDANDASSENSATESDRVTTPRMKGDGMVDKIFDGKSSGFGDGSNSTSDSESVNEHHDKAMILKPIPHHAGYVGETFRRDPGYASDISTRSSPLDYIGRQNKYLPPSQRLSFPYNNNTTTRPPPPHQNYFSEDEALPHGYARPTLPPTYNQAIIDIERMSEKNDITDSEEMYDNLLEMERQLGVTLDDSFESDLNTKALTLPPPRSYSNPRTSGDTGYMSDVGRSSDREKSARCAQLLNEFKSSKTAADFGLAGYDEDDDDERPVQPPSNRCHSVIDNITEEPRVPPVLRRSNSAGASSIYKEWLV